MKQLKMSLRRVFEALHPFRWKFAVMFGFLAVTECVTLVAPYVIGQIFNAMQAGEPIARSLVFASTALLLSLVSGMVMNRKEVYELRYLDFTISKHLMARTLEKILSLSIGQHRGQNSGITRSVVSKGQSSLEHMVNIVLYQLLPIVAQVTITVIFLLWFNVFIGIVVMMGIILHAWLSRRSNKTHWPKVKQLIDTSHQNNKHYSEILHNATLVQVHSQEWRVQREQEERLENFADTAQGVWIPYVFQSSGKQAITILVRYLALGLAIIFFYSKTMQIGDVLIVWSWTLQATSQLWFIGRLERQLVNMWGEVRKYFAILDVESEVKVVDNPIRPQGFVGKVEFRDVSFIYPSRRYIQMDDSGDEEAPSQLPALTHVNFVINSGERVAFVGESGAGKSTIINLLVRGYDPDQGQILVDDHDLRLLDLKHYRESIGLVEQHVELFDATLRYNVLFGLNGRSSSVTEEELEAVSRSACIDRFNHRLTEGWETKIGERGLKLSGGERQRVGIARALIKSPKLLILDEATSNLDPRNERLIKEAVNNASVGRTTIIIAHRLSTVRDADRIYVMDKGSIVASGKHKELCEISEHYRDLVQDQLIHA